MSETTRERVARAIRDADGCGLTVNGEHVFCDDPRAQDPDTVCDCRKLADAVADASKGLLRALLMCAPHHQGGSSTCGQAIAHALNIPFPVRMEGLISVAETEGLRPEDLWPWFKADTALAEPREAPDA